MKVLRLTRRLEQHSFSNSEMQEAKPSGLLLNPVITTSGKPSHNKARWHDSHIQDAIIEVMRANPAKSFEQTANDIGVWCSVRTIVCWTTQQSGLSTYAQCALPLLKSLQKQQHVEFSTQIWNNGNLSRKKIPCINYDEKWFYRWVIQCYAKMSKVLGINKNHTYHHHKCHINKVMAVAFTAFAFDS